MALDEDAQYEFSACYLRITPNNPDGTNAAPDNILGGVGTFDFSGADVTIGSVPLITKADGSAAVTTNINLTAAVDTAAVTVAEIVTAITTAAITNVTASQDGTTGRLKIVHASATIFQVYGQLAELTGIGYGKGVRVVTSNTFKSITDNPNLKDSETFTNTTVKGVDIEVTSDGYRKGTSGEWVDTAMDYVMRSIVEGGTIDATTGAYNVPTSISETVYFKLEVFWAKYAVGTSKEADRIGYTQETVYSCSGTYGDKTRDRNMTDSTYSYIATSPKDSNGNISSDSSELPLTVAEFEALNIESISA